MANPQESGDETLEFFGLLARYLDGEASVEEIAATSGLSARTIWRRIKAHKERGVQGLKRAQRKDKGKRRRVSPELQEAVEGLYLRIPKPSVVWVHEQIEAACIRDNIESPSYTSVWEICSKLDERLKVLAHDGEQTYEQIYDMVIRRQAKYPNHVWQGDHKELDIWAINEQGKLGKVWLTSIIDDYSRMVVGYFLGVGPGNSMRIASALRQAIWIKADGRWPVCGIPEIFYTDRGKDFKSTHIEQAAADLGIRLIRTRKRKPRGKGKIERLFRTADQRFSHKLSTSRGAPVDLAHVRNAFHEWLMTDYQHRKHREIKTSPFKKWDEGKCLPRMPNSLEALDLMLQKIAKPRTMWPDGIRFNNNRYSSMSLSGSVGDQFTVRYDPRDLSSIWVYAEEGKLFCKAVCEELIGQSVPPSEILEARARVKKELKAKIKRKRTAADVFVGEQKSLPPPAQTDKPQDPTPVRRLRRHFHERTQ